MQAAVKTATQILLLVAAWLAGCTGSIRSDVTSFHEDGLPHGETIRVVAANDLLQSSLEFEHYAQLIRAELKRIGYAPVTGDEAAMLVARFDYSVSDGDTIVRTRPQTFSHYYFHYGHYHDPFYYGLFNEWEPETYSYTVFHRDVTLTILRADAPQEHVYEARVHSTGREREIAKVMPYLITAMFANYPGENGVTKVVTIEKDH